MFSTINVTPLTDVMLVLLITFLLSASSFQDRPQDFPLPQVRELSEVQREHLVIGVEKDGTVLWPEGVSTFEALKEDTQLAILALAVHRDCPYGRLYELLEQASSQGWQQVVVLTEEVEVE